MMMDKDDGNHDDECDDDDLHNRPYDHDGQCHPNPNQSDHLHDHPDHLVIDDVESKDADGVDILLMAARAKPPVVAKGWRATF